MHVRFIALIFPVLISAGAIGQGQAATTEPVADTLKAQLYARFDAGLLRGDRQLTNIEFRLAQTPSQRAALEQLVAEQQNPQSPDFHRWISATEYGKRFGAAQESINTVVAWLKSNGMSNIYVARSGRSILFSGSVAAVSSALQTEIHSFSVGGRQHYANVTVPVLPPEIAPLVARAIGLDDFGPTPQLVKAEANYVNGSGGNDLGPDDLATIYDVKPLYSAGFDGTGTTIVIVGQTPIGLNDYQQYRNTFGLAMNDFQSVQALDGTGTNDVEDQLEASLDTQIAGAIARNATILYVWGSSVQIAVEYAIDNQIGSVISMSYAECEVPFDLWEDLALQANAEGITWVVGSGDSGPAGCDATSESAADLGMVVDAPADLPEVTGVGGTAFQYPASSQYWSSSNNAQGGSALSYIPEMGWSNTSSVEAGGGGISALFAKPGFQSESDPAQTAGRLVPDVSFAASPAGNPYAVVFGGSTVYVGGTSAATPLFAGITAILNEYLLENQAISAPGLGNINPQLYLLAATAPSVFHDVTEGSNDVPCQIGSPDCSTGTFGFPAKAGYDEATGLGSIDAYGLVTNWQSATLGTSSVTVTGPAEATAEQNLTFQAVVQTSDGLVAGIPVTFYVKNPVLGGTMNIGSAVTDAPGTATITSNVFPGGSNAVTAIAFGSATIAPSPVSSAASLQVTPFATTTTLSVPNGAFSAGQSAPLSVNVAAPSGISLAGPASMPMYAIPGTASLYSGDGTLLTSKSVPANGSLTFTTPVLTQGSNQFYVSYSGNDFGAGSTSSVVTITAGAAVGIGTTTTLSASSTTVQVGSAVTFTATVSPNSGTATPTGTVVFNNGAASLGSATLSSSGTAQLQIEGLPTGTNSITATYSGDANFNGSTSNAVSVTSEMNAPDFQISTPSSVSLTPGVESVFAVDITPQNNFQGTVQFTCSGLPAGITCQIPASTAVSSATSVSVVLIEASAALAGFPLPLVGLVFASKKRRRWLAVLLLTAGIAMLANGCGRAITGISQTTAASQTTVTYQLTITATSGSISHQAVVSVVVSN